MAPAVRQRSPFLLPHAQSLTHPPDAPTSRITRTLLEHLLTRHGQRCEKSRLGLVLRLAPDDPAPRRISALSNAGEGFVHPPTVDVFVEPRFVDDVRDRYEGEDLQYMVTVRALCVPANYFDDVSFVRNAFTASGDRLPAKAKSLARVSGGCGYAERF